jgi:hypothetical protein
MCELRIPARYYDGAAGLCPPCFCRLPGELSPPLRMLWALGKTGAELSGFDLVAGPTIQTAQGPVGLSPMPDWSSRPGAY